jgi:hypothetical protein
MLLENDMIVVLIDQEKREIKVFGRSGIESFDLDELEEFLESTSGETLLYVTSAMEMDSKQLVEHISGMFGGDASALIEDTGFRYIHSTRGASLHVPEAGLEFAGPDDCKLLDQVLYNIIQQSPQMQSLLRDGRIEIVDERQKRKLGRKASRDYKKHKAKLKLRDQKQLDSIIVDSSEPGSAEDLADRGLGEMSEDDPEVINLLDSGNDETEVERVMRESGRSEG